MHTHGYIYIYIYIHIHIYILNLSFFDRSTIEARLQHGLGIHGFSARIWGSFDRIWPSFDRIHGSLFESVIVLTEARLQQSLKIWDFCKNIALF